MQIVIFVFDEITAGMKVRSLITISDSGAAGFAVAEELKSPSRQAPKSAALRIGDLTSPWQRPGWGFR